MPESSLDIAPSDCSSLVLSAQKIGVQPSSRIVRRIEVPRTHYDNLQVSRTASDRVIRAAYKSLAQQWHPDKNSENPDKVLKAMKIINKAYEVLSDPDLRKEHDAWIVREELAESNLNSSKAETEAARSKPEKRKSQFSQYWAKYTRQGADADAIQARETRIIAALKDALGREPSVAEIERAKWEGMCLID